MNRGDSLMRLSVAIATVCLSLTGVAHADRANALKRLTNIPPQQLEPALESLARVYDLQILYRAEIVRDQRTRGATGDLTREQALAQLLENTGLTYRYLEDKAITIVPV